MLRGGPLEHFLDFKKFVSGLYYKHRAGGNKSVAAQILGIDRVSLWRKLKRYGLEE
jgi:DNA-binding NtrC family response regulator